MSTPTTLITHLLRCGRTVWLRLNGVLNWRTVDQFRHDVDAGVAGSCRRVVMDLSGVDYVGGDVLRALLDRYEQFAARGIELRLVVPNASRCARSLALTGLDRLIPTFTGPIQAWCHRRRRCGGLKARRTGSPAAEWQGPVHIPTSVLASEASPPATAAGPRERCWAGDNRPRSP